MNLENIRSRLKNGFKPFAIELTNGRRFEVPHPEFILIGRHVVGILGRDDVITTIDALHIVSIEDLPSRKRR